MDYSQNPHTLVARHLLRGAAADCVRAPAGTALSVDRWRYGVAHTDGRTGVGDGACAGGGPLLVQSSAGAVVRVGMAGRCGVRDYVAVARTGGSRGAGGFGAGAGGDSSPGEHAAARVRAV